jgi:hypothetical protein
MLYGLYQILKDKRLQNKQWDQILHDKRLRDKEGDKIHVLHQL